MLEVSTNTLREYNGPRKVVIYINGTPVCICRRKRANKLMKYITTGDPIPKDGKIKRMIDYFREEDDKKYAKKILKRFCDRCGKEIEKEYTQIQEGQHGTNRSELCPSCYKSYKEWFHCLTDSDLQKIRAKAEKPKCVFKFEEATLISNLACPHCGVLLAGRYVTETEELLYCINCGEPVNSFTYDEWYEITDKEFKKNNEKSKKK